MRQWTGFVATALLFGVIPGSAEALAGGQQSSTPAITPIITGLNNPRGIVVDEKGNFYVAQAGAYAGTGSGLEQGVTTGSVSKWSPKKHGRHEAPVLQQVWSTPFDALYTSEHGIPEVLGAAGLAGLGPGCSGDWPSDHHACPLLVAIQESVSGFESEDPNTPAPQQLGHLFRLNRADGAAVDVSDVGDQEYQWTMAHQDLAPDFPDADPYGVLITRNWMTGAVRTFVADAAANTVNEINPDGSIRVIAFIPEDGVSDATPTCVAKGPDGALYVGTLDLDKNGAGANPGQSSVWRVDPDTNEDFLHAAHLWATGLTTVTACTFDRRGNFWATEMFQPNDGGPPGDIVRIPFGQPATLTRVGGGQLPFPGGIAGGEDGALFVSINSLTFTPGSGAVVSVKFH